jgi:hypothetical protein
VGSQIFSVRVDGATFSPADQENAGGRWNDALRSAHRKGVTYCLCNGQVPLVIRQYSKEGGQTTLRLSRWQDTGLDHHEDCVYFGETTREEEGSGDLPAMYELENNQIRVHLAASLQKSTITTTAERAPATGESSSRKTRQVAQEISVLSRLWREANLNIYHGKPRQWFQAGFSLLKHAKRLVVDRKGTTFGDLLFLGSQAGDKAISEHNRQLLSRLQNGTTRAFVIGRLRKPDATKERFLLPLLDFAGLPKILCEKSQLDRFIGRRDFLKNILDTKQGSVVVLACIEPAGNDWWKLVTICGFGASKNMVPVESSYELEFEEFLTNAGRRFIKPMIEGEIDSADQRPDFILLDVGPPRVRIEVWGMQTDEYLRGKAARIAQYKAKGQTLLSWNANPREPFPTLPAPNQ